MPPRTPNTPPDDGVFEDRDEPEQIEQKAETPDELKARIKALEAQLARSQAGKAIAEEESARLSAQAQSSMFTTNVTERFSRKAESGKDLYWYRIDLAPCGGTEVKINGVPYYHGSTYEFETDLLRSIKEIVARTWDHENNIQGNNENVYKVAQDRILRGGDRRR
jgi:carboxylesterase type B